MADPKHLATLRRGSKFWNQWRAKHNELPDLSGGEFPSADLRGAKLRGAKLRSVDLGGANLSGADLFLADLESANLKSANLKGAELSEANLERADMTDADLTSAGMGGVDLFEADLTGAVLDGADLFAASLNSANLSGARLAFAHLRGTTLTSANMTGAHIGTTVFSNVDLSAVKGLETVRHTSPSTIGIDTVFASKGRIPESFLRGCGVPDDFIIYMKSLAANPIEFYSCFISYSTKDQAFADRLYADLQNKGVRCWFAPHDVQGGKKLHEQIDEAIRLHDKLLLILSPHSMESEWVKTEIAKARKREVRDPEGVLKRRVLFPILLAPFKTLRDWECFDADTGKDSAREIREYFIPDFSNWKDHDSYQEALKRLITDLKSSD